MKIAINGAGVAGTTLAYWLHRAGHEPIVIEQADKLRTGGYVIDFWGLGYRIAQQMGLIPRLMELGYAVKEVRLLDGNCRRHGKIPIDAFRRAVKEDFLSIRRADLAAAIFEALDPQIEVIFGGSISGIHPHGKGVCVDFIRGPRRDVDLVVGADGLHSHARDLAFGPSAQFEVPLDYHVAAFEAAGYRPRDELVYVTHGAPGRQISRFSLREDKTLILLVFRNEYLDGAAPTGNAEIRTAVKAAFSGVGWETPRMLEAMDAAENIYFDAVSQIHLPSWTTDRVALIGDAAAAVSLLAGEGCGLAMAEAYVLAGELGRAGGDAAAAFDRYQSLLGPFLQRKQKAAASFARAFAPRTHLDLATRALTARLLRIPAVANYAVGRDLMADGIDLPDYGLDLPN